MNDFEKRGFLNQNYRIFHPIDYNKPFFPYHYHDFYKILIFLNGEVTYCIEGKNYSLSPYDIVLLNAGEVHRPIVQSSEPYERIILYVSPYFLQNCQQEPDSLALCFQRTQEEKSNVIKIPSLKGSRLYQSLLDLEHASAHPDYANHLYQNVLFLEFMILLNRAAVHNIFNFHSDLHTNDKILSILSYINEHLTQPISIDLLAETFFISKYHLMHSFKKETGYTIGNYITIKRLLYARELIKQGMTVSESCFSSGFRNYSTFSRAYKKNFGEPPSGNMHRFH